MQLTNVKKTSVAKSVLVDRPSIIMFYPSTYEHVWKSIYNTGLLLNNCRGIVVPNRNMTFFKRIIKGKLHYLDMKKQMLEVKNVSKKLPVTPTINFEKDTKKSIVSPEKNYFFYDLTLIQTGIEYIRDKYPERKVLSIFVEELTKQYNELKRSNPTRNVQLIFDIQNVEDFVFNFFKNIKRNVAFLSEELENKFFDGLLFCSVGDRLYPVAEYEEGKFTPNISMINRMIAAVDAIDLANSVDGLPAISDDDETNLSDKPVGDSLASRIVDVLKDPFSFKVVNQTRKQFVDTGSQVVKPSPAPSVKPVTLKAKEKDEDVEIELDGKTLTKVMRYFKITNPDIIANTKAAIDTYIKETGAVPTKENAERLVMKAVNRSLHGTDEISDQYLANPALLFNKLKDVDVFSTPLEFPKNPNALPFEISDVVTLKSTTGQNRQKFEFSEVIHENIEKVFKTLETQAIHPIKVNKIEHKYIDTDTDRYTEYTVSLTNIDGNKETYTVKLRVPAPVNEKYFKISGNRYIFSAQQHLKPLTKTNKNDVRILTNYAIIRLSTENLRFNVSDTNDILKYIIQRYPNLIKSANEKEVVFNDGDKIYLVGDQVYDGLNSHVIYEDGKLVDTKDNLKFKNNNRFEFLYDIILNKVLSVNPNDKLTKTKLSLPYLAVYLSGVKLPFIIFMWQQKGLLTTLNQFGINYSIVDTPPSSGEYFLEVKDGKFIVFEPTTTRDRLLLNGLLVNKIKYPIINLDDPKEINNHITEVYGGRTLFLIDNIVSNIIDPITKELLQYENHPTNLVGLLSGPALDKLLNDKVDSITDLKIYRTRMSEIILRIMYRQLSRAANSYSHKVDFGDKTAKLMLVPDFVINEFMNRNPPDQSVEKSAGSMLNLTSSVNPIDEIMTASKVIKTGPGGLRSKEEFQPAHRNIHKSHIGNMSAVATPESKDVGIATHHTLNPLILNKYGSYGLKDPSGLTGWDTLGMTEALVPFIQEIYSDRATLAVTHSKQVTPVNNSEPPLVMTGAEAIVPQIASSRFVHKAKGDGVVTDIVPNETMTVTYSNGKVDVLDILPRKSATRRGAFISLEMVPRAVGEKFKKNEILAATKNFNVDENLYVSGRNVSIAVMNFNGKSYEDAYVISDRIASTTTTDTIKEVSVIVPPDTRVFKLEKEIGKMTKAGDDLVEFAYEEDVSSYMMANELEIDDDELENVLGSNNAGIFLKSPGGEIIDIKLYVNDKMKSDKQLISFHKELVKKTESLKDKLKSGKLDELEILSASDNIDSKFITTGEHKYKGIEFRGVRVVYLIKQPKPLRVGDKIAPRYGAKGLIGEIYKDGTAVASKSGNIDMFISPVSILGRKNIAFIKELYIGKLTKALMETTKKMADTPAVKTEEIIKLITDYYKLICSKNTNESIEKKFNKLPLATIRNDLKSGEMKLYTIIEPFFDVSFENIKAAARLLKVELDEYITITTEDGKKITTDVKVPVGITYLQCLEHFSSAYASVGGAVKWNSITKQPVKTGASGNVASVGQLDLGAFITYDADNIIHELLTARSDNHKMKLAMYSTIAETGELYEVSKDDEERFNRSTGGTSDLKDTYIKALGLITK